MNSGSAASVHEALELQKDWNRFTSGGVLVKKCRPNHATPASEMAIQMPANSSTSSRRNRMEASASVLMAQIISEKSPLARRSSSAT